MKNKSKVLFTVLLAISSFMVSNAQWVQVQTPTAGGFWDMEFVGKNYGVLPGADGNVIVTSDGGLSWDTYNTGLYGTIVDVHMTSNKVGYAISIDNGGMAKTTDSGVTWQSLNSGIGYSLRTLHFLNDSVGFYAGQGGVIGKTVDAGKTWVVTQNTSYWLRDFFFLNSDTGFCIGDGGTILKTVDQGESWFSLQSNSFVEQWCVFFIDSDTGFVCGGGGSVLKTTDGGATWNLLTTGSNELLTHMYFFNAEEGYVVGQKGVVLHTYDGGVTWEDESFNDPITFKRIVFLDKDFGLLCGFGDKLFKKCVPSKAEYTFEMSGLNVAFTDTSSNTKYYWWSFGDDEFSAKQNPIHNYSKPGVYTVCLTVTDSCASDTKCSEVTVLQTSIGKLNTNPDIVIYPNPVTDVLHIRAESISEVRIFNMAGILIKNGIGNAEEIDVSLLQAGLYFVEIRSQQNIYRQSLIKK